MILRQISQLCSGSSRDFLNQNILKSLFFPCPSFVEQRKIIEKINSYFLQVEHLKLQLTDLIADLPLLDQSILSKAFRGELVPQDPNDEPASVLLERIQEERGKAEAASGRKSGGKRRGQEKEKSSFREQPSLFKD